MIRRRMALAVAALGVGLAVSLVVALAGNNPVPAPTQRGCLIYAARSCSTNVVLGKAYRFQVPHCGLTSVIDFDGSHWDVEPKSMTEVENVRFGINSDEGTMTLERDDLAVYRSFHGGDAALHRQTRSPSPFLCG